MATRPVKQHYVPQFLLRNFATASKKNPRLWVLDKSDKSIRFSCVRDVAHENHFYQVRVDGAEELDLEGPMTWVDTAGANIIRQIVRNGRLSLSSRDRVLLSYIVACQMLRTPTLRKEMANIRDIIIRRLGPGVRWKDDDKAIGQHGPEDDKLSSLGLIRDVPEYAKVLQTKVWLLEEAPSRCPFITTDNPVARYNMIKNELRNNTGLMSQGIEIHMPISPRYNIHILCPDLATAACITPELAGDFTRSIRTGAPLIVFRDNVLFCNSLQVLWSERFIFAQEKDHLNLALDMLEKNPALADGPRMKEFRG